MRVQNAACGGVLEENPSPLSTGHMRVQNGAVRRRSGGEPIAFRQEYASTERRLRRRSGGEPIASFHRTYASTERRRKAPFWRRTHRLSTGICEYRTPPAAAFWRRTHRLFPQDICEYRTAP